jgi:hypothetical protein
MSGWSPRHSTRYHKPPRHRPQAVAMQPVALCNQPCCNRPGSNKTVYPSQRAARRACRQTIYAPDWCGICQHWHRIATR